MAVRRHSLNTIGCGPVIIAGIALCGALSAVLLLQLGRIGAISGGRPAGRLYPGEEPRWLHVLVNHVTVNGISRSGDISQLANWSGDSRSDNRRMPPAVRAGVMAASLIAVIWPAAVPVTTTMSSVPGTVRSQGSPLRRQSSTARMATSCHRGTHCSARRNPRRGRLERADAGLASERALWPSTWWARAFRLRV